MSQALGYLPNCPEASKQLEPTGSDVVGPSHFGLFGSSNKSVLERKNKGVVAAKDYFEAIKTTHRNIIYTVQPTHNIIGHNKVTAPSTSLYVVW